MCLRAVWLLVLVVALGMLASGCASSESSLVLESDSGAVPEVGQSTPSGAADAATSSETSVPTISVPETSVPTTSVPQGSVPAADVPAADVPADGVSAEALTEEISSTDASDTESNQQAPSSVSTTTVPGDSVPTKTAPSTSASSDSVPTTTVPDTSAPSGSVPTTSVPTTEVPLTPATSVPSTTVPTTSVPSTTVPTTTVPSSRAVSQLAELQIEPEAPRSGYDRGLFRHWIDADGDGCDTRREVLIAEAVSAPRISSRCSLSNGQWWSRYDGRTETGSGRGFDVDHLVPLAEAWDSGAWSWDSTSRRDFANDLGYAHSLIAVSASSNRSKSDRDPAGWMPANDRCWYVAAWIAVKHRWNLTVDTGEYSFLSSQLTSCGSAADAGAAPTASRPTPIAPPPTSSETNTPGEDSCHPAYTPCLPDFPGDAINCGDLTSKQKPVTVKEIGVDPYRLDRDRNGIACTS